MVKSELIEALANKAGITVSEAENVTNLFFAKVLQKSPPFFVKKWCCSPKNWGKAPFFDTRG